MNNEYPNPWNFSNTDKNLFSKNGKYKVEFGALHEIAMGAPIGGECYLIYDEKKFNLNDFCGGPIIWNETNEKIALPIWTKQKKQKIAIVDLVSLTITTFKKEFRVLHFNQFIDNNLFGIDSPIYMTATVNFDLSKEAIETIKHLK
jgi:hypothetical protein